MQKILLLIFNSFILFSIHAQQNNAAVYKDSTTIKFFQRTHGWIASDGGYTIPLSDGSSLWLFGDSHIDDYDSASGTIPCLFQVRNAAILQLQNDWNWHHTKTFIGNGPGIKSFLKNNSDDKYFSWPGTGIQLKDTIYVYCNSLRNTTGGAWGFASAGNDFWGKIKFPEMKVVGYSVLQNFNGINFGSGFVQDEQKEFVYAFGQKLETGNSFFSTSLYVARFPSANPNAAWEFWNGKEWVKDINEITAAAKESLVSFHITKVKDEYLLTSTAFSVGCDQGREVFTSVSNSATGPFSKPKSIYTIDDTLHGHYPFFYLAAAHPEFINEKDEILITYSINGYGTCAEGCINGRMNPDEYRIKAIRVPVDLILE